MRPTQAHFLKMSAQEAHESAQPLENISEYEKMLMLLTRYKRDLKHIQSRERKSEFKRKHLIDFIPWIESVLKSDSGKQDDIFMICLVWAIDAEEYTLALNMASHALYYNLVLPDNFERTLPTLIAEEFAENAHYFKLNKREFDVYYLERAEQLTREFDIPDIVRAKLLKEIGLLKIENDPESALNYLEKALGLNTKVGVKDSIKKLKKQLNK